ncbi:MAG: RNA-binding S4 domain-containing protein [Bacteroidales bacterium]
MPANEGPRIDKWLWAVRVFKTRSLATQACRSGKVKVDDLEVKPSREVRKGMVIELRWGPIIRHLKVLDLLEKRVGAKLVAHYMQDLTPEEEYHKLELLKTRHTYRPKGSGRPTKKERRDLDYWFGWED